MGNVRMIVGWEQIWVFVWGWSGERFLKRYLSKDLKGIGKLATWIPGERVSQTWKEQRPKPWSRLVIGDVVTAKCAMDNQISSKITVWIKNFKGWSLDSSRSITWEFVWNRKFQVLLQTYRIRTSGVQGTAICLKISLPVNSDAHSSLRTPGLIVDEGKPQEGSNK